ncbi:putative protein p51 [Clostridium pasteurianum DSM 525 = ATCC 6013]|uniref:DUF2800 domain-containing protein n=1 Tax=Clostridium pasteurianum DSM 525 = ATCC 6013 TaxID=1262449 RepID=A0A0H3JB17_CLOPA|nr:DUF2800 domain-containing protein [Clostridium pasteurianum]AJA50083.1 putative protein p51 [Clostridium pasteurianum DSM 525 = ATCC 6013]AJA54071.1 putative protein p51 [Clostridium pasteurianum DSM 525 = ATCC 6013]AOZ77201.1 hypothetical protein AQ983_19695 [Clostridium pasteurianum DSM 525 = ATCC 6013]AOZ80997.1 hypothetical protein AQ984_19690 [Clostridium pasteurianum]ELP59216.1 phage-like protein [Clostridium pasteurianum DSM 525 = ATCC 6013]
MAQHAILSASSASRWMACPPCARLEQKFENRTSPYAAEGTLAHELGEINLKHSLGEINKRKLNSEIKKIESHELYTADMPDYVETYVNTCLEKVSEAKAKTKDALFKIEQRLDFSEWVPEGFGTGDFVIIADGTMEICDLKYGKGVPVSAIGNKQMRLYALGAIAEFGFLYDIENVKMTIIQPRLDSISTDEISADELIEWAEEFVKPTAQLAFNGEGEFCAGEHCGFCRAKTVCKARADKNLELAKYEFRTSDTLSDKDIADILGKAEELSKWAKDIQEYALDQALQGANYEGWKIVEGRSNRKYTDTEKVAEILLNNEYKEDKIYKPKELQGLTNMEKLVGKKKLTELVGEFIVKPPGKPVLVNEDDKRPVFNSAKADFQEVKEK